MGQRKYIPKHSRLIVVLLLLPLTTAANAVPVDVNVYGGDFLIEEGDEYHWVNVYNDANITMTGGEVDTFWAYDTSTLSIYQDAVVGGLVADHNSVSYVSGGLFDGIETYGSSILHMSGGEIDTYGSMWADDSSTVNIYGYDFVVTQWPSDYSLSGYWPTGNEFYMVLRGTETYSHVVLHEVPEPLCVSFLCVGILLIRNRRKIRADNPSNQKR